jgi:hypothetical protein
MKKYVLVGIIVIVIGLVGLFTINKALGNPLFFPGIATISEVTATTTGSAYMTPGTGTTTIGYDSYQITQGSASPQNATAPISLTALVHLTATTGVPTLNINCEASRDGIEWYKRGCYNAATTTNLFSLMTDLTSYEWVFASSTCRVGGAADSATQSTCTRAFEVKPISRFTRLIFSLASTTKVSTIAADNASIYAELVSTKEEK